MAPLVPSAHPFPLPPSHTAIPESWKVGMSSSANHPPGKPTIGGAPAPKNAGGTEPKNEPVVFSPNTQESQTIPAAQPTPQTPEDESVLHEPVLDKNILSKLVGDQLKVHPTQSNQESLAKAIGILEQVQKLRQNLNQIQLGPLEPVEEEEGKKQPELSPPEMALKKMVEEGHICPRGAEGQRVMRTLNNSKTDKKVQRRENQRGKGKVAPRDGETNDSEGGIQTRQDRARGSHHHELGRIFAIHRNLAERGTRRGWLSGTNISDHKLPCKAMHSNVNNAPTR